MSDPIASEAKLRRRKTDSLNGWFQRNVAWIVTVIFLSGGLVASWGIHIRTADARITKLELKQVAAVEAHTALAIELARLNESVVNLRASVIDLKEELRTYRTANESGSQ